MHYLGHTHPKKAFLVDLKFKWNWVSSILSGNPRPAAIPGWERMAAGLGVPPPPKEQSGAPGRREAGDPDRERGATAGFELCSWVSSLRDYSDKQVGE